MTRGSITCKVCGTQLKSKSIGVITTSTGDENGVYVEYQYICPVCGNEITDERLKSLYSYPAPSPDEPLRWES